MLRNLLLLILSVLVVRAVTRALIGVVAGSAGRPRQRHPGPDERTAAASSVHMIRDPVCGTYVIPDRAVPLTDGSHRLFFCSAECRDTYRSRPAEGRTA